MKEKFNEDIEIHCTLEAKYELTHGQPTSESFSY